MTDPTPASAAGQPPDEPPDEPAIRSLLFDSPVGRLRLRASAEALTALEWQRPGARPVTLPNASADAIAAGVARIVTSTSGRSSPILSMTRILMRRVVPA